MRALFHNRDWVRASQLLCFGRNEVFSAMAHEMLRSDEKLAQLLFSIELRAHLGQLVDESELTTPHQLWQCALRFDKKPYESLGAIERSITWHHGLGL